MNKKIILYITFLFHFLVMISQYGPGGVGSNDGKSSLKLWLDADKGVFSDSLQTDLTLNNQNVKAWKDLSGSENHAYSRADTTSPRLQTNLNTFNNHNSLRFYKDGSTNKRTFLKTKTYSKTNDITIYCVFNAVTKAAGNNFTPYKAKNYNDTMWYAGAGIIDGGAPGFVNDFSLSFCDTSIAAGVGDSSTLTDYCLKTKASLNQTYFTCMQKEAWSGMLSLYLNNSSITTYKAGKQPINNPYAYFIGSNIGIDAKGNIQFFDGHIANILIYNKILNSAEKIIVENYLAANYNLPLKNNDIFTFDNPSEGNYDFDLIGIGKSQDGSFQSQAKGTGILGMSNFKGMNPGSFLFLAHNGNNLNTTTRDLPLAIKNKLNRNWIASVSGQEMSVDLSLDAKQLGSINTDKLVLLIDTDRDGSYADEILGVGILSDFTIDAGQIIFRDLKFQHGNTFTFAELDTKCIVNCNSFFTPNGDGIDDTYYFNEVENLQIYNRNGELVKTITGPSFWEGTDNFGKNLDPGIYFIISEKGNQSTLTIIK